MEGNTQRTRLINLEWRDFAELPALKEQLKAAHHGNTTILISGVPPDVEVKSYGVPAGAAEVTEEAEGGKEGTGKKRGLGLRRRK